MGNRISFLNFLNFFVCFLYLAICSALFGFRLWGGGGFVVVWWGFFYGKYFDIFADGKIRAIDSKPKNIK